jgi:hypothetical protein
MWVNVIFYVPMAPGRFGIQDHLKSCFVCVGYEANVSKRFL